MPKQPEIVAGYCLRCGDTSGAGPMSNARSWERLHNADAGADTECIILSAGQRIDLEEPFLPNTLAEDARLRTSKGGRSRIVAGWIDGVQGIFFRLATGEVVAYPR